jgi:hypothetical protein
MYSLTKICRKDIHDALQLMRCLLYEIPLLRMVRVQLLQLMPIKLICHDGQIYDLRVQSGGRIC